ncbi:uncharacterized protein LOC131079082 isoform X1 [Cryptomeria japonica]|uniref:uncharacterized protein LOC131079082 isoform X1 n=1 Tax=Cryptomeria japonica TaxID=3369 RepID=UPI0025AD51E5|nr:uncharacterized protein LOC131079082 isoform X1 [Cryptomeria japonica]
MQMQMQTQTQTQWTINQYNTLISSHLLFDLRQALLDCLTTKEVHQIWEINHIVFMAPCTIQHFKDHQIGDMKITIKPSHIRGEEESFFSSTPGVLEREDVGRQGKVSGAAVFFSKFEIWDEDGKGW